MSHRLCKGHEATLGQRASQGRRHVRSSSAAAVPGGAGGSWPGQLAISLISRAMLFFESKVDACSCPAFTKVGSALTPPEARECR